MQKCPCDSAILIIKIFFHGLISNALPQVEE